MTHPEIRELAIIGDRRTAAVVSRHGDILWYCPGRFDRPSIFAGLLDPGGGAWRISLPGAKPARRTYVEESGVLETVLKTPSGELTIKDWMPAGSDVPAGMICRHFSASPGPMISSIHARPDYARGEPSPELISDTAASINGGSQYLYASHKLRIHVSDISFDIGDGDAAWAVLSDHRLAISPSTTDLAAWLAGTLAYWRELAKHTNYNGAFRREVSDSLRAIRLLSHELSGGIIAAVTTSLPEVLGGSKNWDYRYVWMRDSGMIASALTRIGSDLTEGRRYLDFVCASRGSSQDYPVAAFVTLDCKAAPKEECLNLAGYEHSRPIRIGNDAVDQLQLDAYGNVLLAAKLLYERSDCCPHWEAVVEMADFLVDHWNEPDHGLWEEKAVKQYTSSKVIAARALESVADFSDSVGQAARWRSTARDIREFVAEHCLTSTGAYAAVAGGEEVDVSAALFPVWAYTDPDTPAMKATLDALERRHSWKSLLYWRHLESADAKREGIFLAGTFWVAQYWIMVGDLDRARSIIDAALYYANDLGLFSEEGDPGSGLMIGNIAQSFVHAAFIGVAIDYTEATKDQTANNLT